MRWAGGLAAMLLVPGASAPAGELAADRPDFTESAVSVPRHALQIEGGLTLERDAGREGLAAPEALLRYGLLERLELRLVLPVYLSAEGSAGWTDPALGTKLQLGPLGGVDLAGLAAVTLPAGSGELSAGTTPLVAIVGSVEITGRLSAASQLTVLWPEGAPPASSLTAVLAVGLADRVSTFLEFWGGRDGAETRYLVHHGYVAGLSEDVQIDIHGGTRLGPAGPDLFLGAGVAVILR